MNQEKEEVDIAKIMSSIEKNLLLYLIIFEVAMLSLMIVLAVYMSPGVLQYTLITGYFIIAVFTDLILKKLLDIERVNLCVMTALARAYKEYMEEGGKNA